MNQPSSGVKHRNTDPDRSTTADRAYLVLQVLLQLGPGAHSLAEVIARSGLPRSTVHRMLQSGVRLGMFEQPTYGYYEVTPTPQQAASQSYLTAIRGNSPAIKAELAQLQRRTGQVAALHIQDLLGTPTRVCKDVAVGNRFDFAAAMTPEAGALLRQAPLNHDAAGLVILANLDDSPGPRAILRHVRIKGHALTKAPLPNWQMLSVPLWSGSVLVGSVSLLAPGSYLESRATRMTDVTMDAAAAISRDMEQARAIRQTLPPLARAS